MKRGKPGRKWGRDGEKRKRAIQKICLVSQRSLQAQLQRTLSPVFEFVCLTKRLAGCVHVFCVGYVMYTVQMSGCLVNINSLKIECICIYFCATLISLHAYFYFTYLLFTSRWTLMFQLFKRLGFSTLLDSKHKFCAVAFISIESHIKLLH